VSYEEVVERARAAAAVKRLAGEVPEGTGAALDRLFLEVAPGGARPEGEGLGAVVDMLGRYRYDPSISVASGPGMRGRVSGLAKRAMRPVTVWTLRHLTDQLNAYHLAETELLRLLVQTNETKSEAPRGAPQGAGSARGGPEGPAPD
jgi:hypothetical protein